MLDKQDLEDFKQIIDFKINILPPVDKEKRMMLYNQIFLKVIKIRIDFN